MKREEGSALEYVQMTLSDWAAMKEGMKQDLIGVQESFVRIGYKLRKAGSFRKY